jgi:ribosomal-protein-alanine N-acetyltransferase
MLKQLCALHHLCFPDKPWSERDFMDLKRAGCDIISSENGFIVYRVAADEAEIITIGVNPAVRGTGIARAMLAIAEIDIKKLGAAKIFLEVADNNLAARMLYERHGYHKIGTRPKYYDGTDALLMEKVL